MMMNEKFLFEVIDGKENLISVQPERVMFLHLAEKVEQEKIDNGTFDITKSIKRAEIEDYCKRHNYIIR